MGGLDPFFKTFACGGFAGLLPSPSLSVIRPSLSALGWPRNFAKMELRVTSFIYSSI
jgi:hypothetical protein